MSGFNTHTSGLTAVQIATLSAMRIYMQIYFGGF